MPGPKTKNSFEQGKARRLSPTGPDRVVIPPELTRDSRQDVRQRCRWGRHGLKAVPRKWELLVMVERRNAARVLDRTPATPSRIRMTEDLISRLFRHAHTRPTAVCNGPL